MKNKISSFVFGLSAFLLTGSVYAGTDNTIIVDQSTNGTGFAIPTFSGILTFAIRGFFIIAGLAALFYLLLGALAWVTSGGNKENVEKAQQKIQQAVVGVILVAVVLAVVSTLENVVFNKKVCFGLTCEIKIPSLLK